MLTYREESLLAIQPEIEALLPLHWEEVALNQDTIKLDPTWDTYKLLENTGHLCCATAREEDQLVGYAIFIHAWNLHYKTVRVADSDSFFLHPEHRKGMAGVRLFQAAEKALKAQGVRKIVIREKIHRNIGRVFERLGYRAIETNWSRLI